MDNSDHAATGVRSAAARDAATGVHRARGLAPDDARWVLAARTWSMIEGGRAAIIRPEARHRLIAIAARLGLRPFDTSLIIAIVQDAARRGARLDAEVESRLGMLSPPATPAHAGVWWSLAASALIAAGLLAAAVHWIA